MTRYYEFTEAGKWFVRTDKGSFGSNYYDTYDELLVAVFAADAEKAAAEQATAAE